MKSALSRLTVISLIAVFAAIGCSNQYRTAELGLSGAEVMQRLTQIENETVGTSGGNSIIQKFFQLVQTPGASIYFADGPSPLGPVISVFSMASFDFLGQELATRSFADITNVQIAFVDLNATSGRDCALMMDFTLADSSQITRFFACSQAPDASSGEYLAVLEDSLGTQIVLRSFDVDQNQELNGVIQMKLSDIDPAGNERYIGKFSTLVGFGG